MLQGKQNVEQLDAAYARLARFVSAPFALFSFTPVDGAHGASAWKLPTVDSAHGASAWDTSPFAQFSFTPIDGAEQAGFCRNSREIAQFPREIAKLSRDIRQHQNEHSSVTELVELRHHPEKDSTLLEGNVEVSEFLSTFYDQNYDDGSWIFSDHVDRVHQNSKRESRKLS